MRSDSELLAFRRGLMARVVVARYLEGRAFPSDKALREYLKEHPNAQKARHWVEESKDSEAPAEGEKAKAQKVIVPKPSAIPRQEAGKGKPPKEPGKAARVGVAGDVVPPPPNKLKRFNNLTPEEEQIQNAMCEMFESDPDGIARHFSNEVAAKSNWTFETDAAKALLPAWSRPDLPPDPKGKVDPERADFRGRYNALLHQAANAIVKRAFVSRLDDIAKMPEEQRNVLVTSGGVAAGKGMALGAEPGLAKNAAATWDAAGEQNSTENEWIMKECEKRGIRPTFLFVHSDPMKTWNGVVERAKGQGRMVDAQLFADSYATGAKNFKEFYDKYKDKANFSFGVLEKDEKGAPVKVQETDEDGKPKVDADGKPVYKVDPGTNRPVVKPPKMMREFPDEALRYSTEDIYENAAKELDRALDAGEIGDHIYQGGTAGRRIFKDEG